MPSDQLVRQALETFFIGVEVFLKEGLWEPFSNNCDILDSDRASWHALPKVGFFTHSAFKDSLSPPADYAVRGPRLKRLLERLGEVPEKLGSGRPLWLADALQAGWPAPALSVVASVAPCADTAQLWRHVGDWIYAQQAWGVDHEGYLLCQHDDDASVVFWRQGQDVLSWMAAIDPGMKSLDAFSAQAMLGALGSLPLLGTSGDSPHRAIHERLARLFDFPRAPLREELWSHEGPLVKELSWADVAARMKNVELMGFCTAHGVPLVRDRALARKIPAFRPFLVEERLRRTLAKNAASAKPKAGRRM